MICECEHPASAHDLGGDCDQCSCEEFVPMDGGWLDDDWQDEEADVNDFRDLADGEGRNGDLRIGWNDHPLTDPDDF